jgi:hypothetical protein
MFSFTFELLRVKRGFQELKGVHDFKGWLRSSEVVKKFEGGLKSSGVQEFKSHSALELPFHR